MTVAIGDASRPVVGGNEFDVSQNGGDGAIDRRGVRLPDGTLSTIGWAAAAMAQADQAETPVSSEVDRSSEVYRVQWDPNTYEVHVDSDVTLNDYRERTLPEDWALMEEFAAGAQGKSVVFLNPTYEGGGVAMLRPPLVHMLRQLGVDAHWFVMAPMQDTSKGNPFVVTKLMHNISQRQAGDARISEEGKALHKAWADENLAVLGRQPEILDADVLFYDDPQPTPLLEEFRRRNPSAKIVWRNHIDTDAHLMANGATPQGEVSRYLLYELGLIHADAVIAHPVERFVHEEFKGRAFFAPATTDPFDDLNRPLTEAEQDAGFDFINDEIVAKNLEFAAQGRFEDMQSLMDPNKRHITLIARFDESKGMDKAMELGVQARRRMRAMGVPENELPEVVIVGNGSVDDPSGVPMYEKVLKLRRERYPSEKEDIIVMRLKHNYAAMSALMHKSTLITQTSMAEGCETRVSDAIEHGVPVIVSNRGGIPTQVVEGESGYVLDFSRPDFDLPRGAQIIAELLTDADRYKALVASTHRKAKEFNSRDFTTVANVTRLLRVFNAVLTAEGPVKADRLWHMGDLVTARAVELGRV